MSVYRIFVEKKAPFDVEAQHLLSEIRSILQIKSLQQLRLLNRYDVEGIDGSLFEQCKNIVFSEPQVDVTYTDLPIEDCMVFAVEYLPGQFDQRADSCAQCIQIVSQGERPTVQTARVFLLYGALSSDDLAAIKRYVINPVDSREASLATASTLKQEYEIPTTVKTLSGFTALTREQLDEFITDYGLAMDLDDILFCQQYFKEEGRNPTITEIRMIDTYWSDHCRHTTFLTTLDSASFEDATVKNSYENYLSIRQKLGREHKPINLMDLATIGAKYLKHTGQLKNLDESDEINACTVKIDVDVNGQIQPWLFLFKNETHNHPTEIEPFGGAATCLGGAIRDPLSGRGYVYQAMRVTGAGDPLVPVSKTLPGKLPQRKLVTTAAAGYSSYGNQIGLATGMVDELYHPGYVAKRLEIGAVLGAAPAANVRREVPSPGDIVVLLGGRTGRDGCGGATGSSKSHSLSSLEQCGAEVQKGNPPEERKLQRLFRNPKASELIKRCNDFGAGGVSVAIGELADGLLINLNAVPKKYDGLDGTELAISESQERMAVVLDPADVDAFTTLAKEENLEATVVAVVTKEPRLIMQWNGNDIVNISRDFLNSNGAEKHAKAAVKSACYRQPEPPDGQTLSQKLTALMSDLNVCSKKGLSQRFDSTIGAGTVLMPFGGVHQLTPVQAMVAKIPVEKGDTTTCSAMAWGYNPYLSEQSPYHGAYLAVVESVSKVVAAGGSHTLCYLTFQEFFERLRSEPQRWGKPLASLLGALDAQVQLGIGAIGGKDSMSGSFEQLDVPPTLVSFAVSTLNIDHVISPELKKPGSRVVLLSPEYGDNQLPKPESLLALYAQVEELIQKKQVLSVYTPGFGGIAEGLVKMTMGNQIGFALDASFPQERLFQYAYGSFILELSSDAPELGTKLGTTLADYTFAVQGETVSLAQLQKAYEDKLEPVLPCNTILTDEPVPAYCYNAPNRVAPKIGIAKPKVLIPVFPGTNCEYDSAKAVTRAGGEADILVIQNLTSGDIAASVAEMAKRIEQSQIIFIPGGFSGGDEPEGSGKFINAFFRSPIIKESVHKLLKERDGLMCGICNGFQALIKLGLVPYGEIIDTDSTCPTLTFNTIGRHQSGLVNTRIASNKSPWLQFCQPGDIHTIAISHGEGRFVANPQLIAKLAENGQIATQYVDLAGNPSMDIRYNPNTSVNAIEGITSPDGRIFGKMGHSERYGSGLYQNVPGNKDQRMFEGAVAYYAL